MRLKPSYCVWEGYFSDDFCDKVTAFADTLEFMEGEVRYDPVKKSRSSNVAWITDKPENEWIIEPVADLVAVTNRKYWQWDITGRERFQYTRYGAGQFYGWHADARPEPYPDDGRWPGLIRKISVTVSLSHEDDYDGGDFALEEVSHSPGTPEKRINIPKQAKKRGSAIIFASHLYHEVRPVTEGLRQSLVGWFLGPPFR